MAPAARRVRRIVITSMFCAALPRAAAAQAPAPKGGWTVEFYAGGSSSSASTGGTPIAGFDAGAPFTTASSQPSRAESSWYFGDGAVLLNQVLSQFSSINGTTFPRIAPADDAVRRAGASRGSGATFGARIGRSISRRLRVEGSVDHGPSPFEISSAMKASLQTTSDTFKSSFQALLNTAPVTGLSVTSTLGSSSDANSQTRASGTLTWTLAHAGRIDAYVTGGAGVVTNSAKAPTAVLSGRYAFSFFGTYPMDESDRVVISVSQPKTSTVGVIGGGVFYNLSARVGLRGDVRVLLHNNGDVTTLTATPTVSPGNPTSTLPSVTNPSIQFSTQSGVRSSLGGASPTIQTFHGSGLDRQVSFTFGIFRRF